MNLNDLLPAGGINALANQLGVPRDQAQRGAEALLPSILGGMGDKAGGADAANAGGLQSHIEALGGGSLADNVTGPEPTAADRGNQLLGGIFGSKEVSRQVAGHAAQNTGMDASLLKRMLPILAMLVAGHMAKRAGGQQGGLGGILGSALGSIGASGGGGLGGILGTVLGGRTA